MHAAQYWHCIALYIVTYTVAEPCVSYTHEYDARWVLSCKVVSLRIYKRTYFATIFIWQCSLERLYLKTCISVVMPNAL